jgi:exopolysaccharide biosynthesis polyprenyl glycosylphosphotransferase
VRRGTDPAGWYKEKSILGIIFTELGALDDTATVNRLLQRVREELPAHLSKGDLPYVRVTAHIFTDESTVDESKALADPAFYPDLFYRDKSKKISLLAKRALDIVGSSAALLFFSPLFVVIAVLVKLTSKGPVLFKQPRLGQFGKTFTCLKFRSMHANNDLKIHQEFMKNLISGEFKGKGDGKSKRVFKMTDDPRITRIGRIIRRSSLDELPQFINVLKGEMSLVGPRPPLAYEYEEYDLWHRRRVLEVKPGITGLWQVNGRSRVSFDEMVRLDLRYARTWSIALDLQILARTPLAVLFGDGAY